MIAREDERNRVSIEGKFGQGKRRFNLGRIMSKGSDTSACRIVMIFLVMNLMKWLKVIFYALFIWLADMAEGGMNHFVGLKKNFAAAFTCQLAMPCAAAVPR